MRELNKLNEFEGKKNDENKKFKEKLKKYN